jgi:hypothetical protein
LKVVLTPSTVTTTLDAGAVTLGLVIVVTTPVGLVNCKDSAVLLDRSVPVSYLNGLFDSVAFNAMVIP